MAVDPGPASWKAGARQNVVFLWMAHVFEEETAERQDRASAGP